MAKLSSVSGASWPTSPSRSSALVACLSVVGFLQEIVVRCGCIMQAVALVCQWVSKACPSACKRPFAVSMPMSAQSKAVPCVQMQSKSSSPVCADAIKVQSSPVCADAIKVQSSPVCADAIKVQRSPVGADAIKVQSSPVCADAVKVQSSPVCADAVKVQSSPVEPMLQVSHIQVRVSADDVQYGWQVGSTGHLVWRGMSDKFIDPSMFAPIAWPYRTTLMQRSGTWFLLEHCAPWTQLRDVEAPLPGEGICEVITYLHVSVEPVSELRVDLPAGMTVPVGLPEPDSYSAGRPDADMPGADASAPELDASVPEEVAMEAGEVAECGLPSEGTSIPDQQELVVQGETRESASAEPLVLDGVEINERTSSTVLKEAARKLGLSTAGSRTRLYARVKSYLEKQRLALEYHSSLQMRVSLLFATRMFSLSHGSRLLKKGFFTRPLTFRTSRGASTALPCARCQTVQSRWWMPLEMFQQCHTTFAIRGLMKKASCQYVQPRMQSPAVL